jgi:hypothetical protein
MRESKVRAFFVEVSWKYMYGGYSYDKIPDQEYGEKFKLT